MKLYAMFLISFWLSGLGIALSLAFWIDSFNPPRNCQCIEPTPQ